MISIIEFLVISAFFLILVIALIVAIIFIKRGQDIQKKQNIFEHFDGYIAILQYHMEKAYDIVHKDQILIYSLEATGIPDDKFDEASSSFGKLVIKMLGPMLYGELRYLYGDDALIFNIVEYFNSKYEADEIRSTALENLTADEEEIK